MNAFPTWPKPCKLEATRQQWWGNGTLAKVRDTSQQVLTTGVLCLGRASTTILCLSSHQVQSGFQDMQQISLPRRAWTLSRTGTNRDLSSSCAITRRRIVVGNATRSTSICTKIQFDYQIPLQTTTRIEQGCQDRKDAHCRRHHIS